jgi:hypothetical protein
MPVYLDRSSNSWTDFPKIKTSEMERISQGFCKLPEWDMRYAHFLAKKPGKEQRLTR